MNNFEIEIKSLLGSKENAEALVAKMKAKDKNLFQHETHKQLNHYFVPIKPEVNLQDLYKNTEHLIPDLFKSRFKTITEKAKDFSVRTRLADDRLLLVIKASIDDTTSSNGTARLEFEAPIANLTLEDLDNLILKSGFQYQAKWSRERTNYEFLGTDVSIDKNAGYGYLAEFEKVITNENLAERTKEDLRRLMAELGVSELPQDRLERMFAYYNSHWPEYYGTDKIFNIE